MLTSTSVERESVQPDLTTSAAVAAKSNLSLGAMSAVRGVVHGVVGGACLVGSVALPLFVFFGTISQRFYGRYIVDCQKKGCEKDCLSECTGVKECTGTWVLESESLFGRKSVKPIPNVKFTETFQRISPHGCRTLITEQPDVHTALFFKNLAIGVGGVVGGVACFPVSAALMGMGGVQLQQAAKHLSLAGRCFGVIR